MFDITDPEDLTQLAEPLKILVGMGLQVPQTWLHDKTRIPKPANNEPVLMPEGTLASAPSLTQNNEQQKPPSALAALAASKITQLKLDDAKARFDESEHQLDTMGQQLATNMQPVLGDHLEQIGAIVASADSLEELQALLAEFDLSIDEASELMQQAFVAGDLAGQYDVSEGN